MAITFVALPGVVPSSLSCILGATCQRGTTAWWSFMVDPKTRDGVAPTALASSTAQEGTYSPA